MTNPARRMPSILPTILVMRKVLLALAVLGSAVYGSAAGVFIPPPTEGPVQATVIEGEKVTFSGPPAVGAETVEFTIKDSGGSVVYDSGPLPATGGTVTFDWFPLFDGTFTVEEHSYVGGVSVGTSPVVYVQSVRPDAYGAITGGGWFTASTGRDSFGFVGQVLKNGTIKGSVEFQDHGKKVNMKSSALDWVYASSAEKGYISGTCTLNGQGTHRFFLEVADRGEPGTSDSLKVWVYDAEGTLLWSYESVLDGGNIQIKAK